MIVDFKLLCDTYKEIRKNVKNKNRIYNFEKNKMEYIYIMQNIYLKINYIMVEHIMFL